MSLLYSSACISLTCKGVNHQSLYLQLLLCSPHYPGGQITTFAMLNMWNWQWPSPLSPRISLSHCLLGPGKSFERILPGKQQVKGPLELMVENIRASVRTAGPWPPKWPKRETGTTGNMKVATANAHNISPVLIKQEGGALLFRIKRTGLS